MAEEKKAPDRRFPQYVYRKGKGDDAPPESKVVKDETEFSAAVKAGFKHADDFHGISDHGTNPSAKPKQAEK